MLVIRLQRTGRSGHAMFRIIVQDARRSPTSGNIVHQLGHYDPHSKAVTLDKEKAEFYIAHGAQPSNRLIGILKAQGVKLPAWAVPAPAKEKSVRNPEKRRSTAPEGVVVEKPAETDEETPDTEPAEAEASAPEAETPAASEPSIEEPPATEPAEEEKSQAKADETPAEAANPKESAPAESADEKAAEAPEPEPEKPKAASEPATSEKAKD